MRRRCCLARFTVECNGSPVSGATVQVQKTGYTASGVTDAAGVVALAIPAPDTYTVTATSSGLQCYSSSLTLTGCGSYTLSCCGGAMPCSPCAIPEKNLTVEWDFPAFPGAAFVGTGSAPLIYTAGASYPWLTNCVANGTATGCSYTNVPSSIGIAFKCGPSTFSFSYNTTCSFDQFCGQITYTFPASGSWTLTSYTCSPFSMTWTNVVNNGTVTESITIHE